VRPLVWLALAASVAGCSHRVARPINPGAPRCQESLREAFALILVAQEEAPEVAEAVGAAAAQQLAEVDLGPRPFKLSSPSGVDYGFFFEDEGKRCLLHLVAWQKGFVQVSNNVTYIATRPLTGCRCEK
jgi:hypothetical protein